MRKAFTTKIALRIAVDPAVKCRKPVIEGTRVPVELVGQSNETVSEFAQEQEAVLLTGDLGFPRRNAFEFASHYGVVVARFPAAMSTDSINAEILKSFSLKRK